VKDRATGRSAEVSNGEYLTPLQEKMMSTQPDMIVKFARHIACEYRKKGFINPEVFGAVYVSLNGQRSRLFIDTSVNLAAQRPGPGHYSWVLPYAKTDEKK
jgi:hypothetical protein